MAHLTTDNTFGHYRLEGLLGAGSMGIVYLARDLRLDRQVAVKVLGTDIDTPVRMWLRDEALTLSKLSHPNIAAVFDFDSDGVVDFLVMEYVTGSNLDVLLRHAPFDTARVASLGSQLARGLAAAHRAGVIHRDIKPGNLRVTPEGLLKILDFGIATRAPRHPEHATTRTDNGRTHWLAGTLAYMAPERLRGAAADARSDIFSAGAVLYEMACGLAPFRETQPVRLIESILSATPIRPSTINARLHSALDAVVMRALEKDPRRRYASAEELASSLDAVARASWPTRMDVVTGARSVARWFGRLAGMIVT